MRRAPPRVTSTTGQRRMARARAAPPTIAGLLVASLFAPESLAQPVPPAGVRPPLPRPYSAEVWTEADDPGDEGEPRYYGWQNFTAVGLSASLFASGILVAGSTRGEAGTVLMVAGVAGYAFGGPIVHWAHGNVGKGFISLALHLAIPFTTTFIGFAAGCSSGDAGLADCVVGTLIGWQIGIVIPPIIDGTALGWDSADPEERASVPRLRIGPVASPTAPGVGLSGAF